MRRSTLALSILVFLSGCGWFKGKASEHYLSNARKTASKESASQTEIEQAYFDIAKSLKYDPSSKEAVAVLEKLTDTASRGGSMNAFDLEMGVLRPVLERTPYNWPAWLAVINAVSVRGDVFALNETAARLETLAAAKDNPQPYETSLALALCYSVSAPWVESEGLLNLNKDPDIVVKDAVEYIRLLGKVGDLKKKLEAMGTADPAAREKAPQELVSSVEVAMNDIFKNAPETARLGATVTKIGKEPEFAKAVELTIKGNASLMRKEYSQARALYESALQHYPGFIDATKQAAEVDFQEGAGLALAGGGIKEAKQLLYSAYEATDEVIEEAQERTNWLPFMSRDKFLADTYSVRAAVISAIRTIEKSKLKNKARLEKEFKAALDQAVKLNPEGKLARDLLERYDKEGF